MVSQVNEFMESAIDAMALSKKEYVAKELIS